MRFKNVNKILLLRQCCLGDVAMLTPVITNLHLAFPDAEIKIAASGWIKALLPYIPHIAGAVIFDAPLQSGFFKRLSGTIKFIFALRKEKFDMVFTAHRNKIYGVILKLAGIRYRLGFTETSFMTHKEEYDSDIHFVDRHLKILSSCGIKVNDSSLKLIPKYSRQQLLHELGFSQNDIVIGIFPFGGSNPGTHMDIKRWELSKFIELAGKYKETGRDVKMIIFQGHLPDEKIVEEFPPGSNIMKTKLTFDLISACDIFLSGDTGPLFIAEGFGLSTLSIFGPSDAEKIAPKSSHPGTLHKAIWKKPHCAPCYTAATAFDRKNPKFWNGNSFICWTGTHECIAAVSSEEVKAALDEIIEHVKKTIPQ